MSSVEIEIDRSRTEVWRELMDAEGYPRWLMGAQHVDAPAEWPRPGASFEHRIGGGPVRIPGSTTSREVEEPHRFRLTAGMGPLGEADVTFELEELGPRRTRVRMSERPNQGLVRAGDRLAHPIVDRVIDLRNQASLRRLRDHLADGA
jgi:uncharacterized protein YndB with AHSA1/START domain